MAEKLALLANDVQFGLNLIVTNASIMLLRCGVQQNYVVTGRADRPSTELLGSRQKNVEQNSAVTALSVCLPVVSIIPLLQRSSSRRIDTTFCSPGRIIYTQLPYGIFPSRGEVIGSCGCGPAAGRFSTRSIEHAEWSSFFGSIEGHVAACDLTNLGVFRRDARS